MHGKKNRCTNWSWSEMPSPGSLMRLVKCTDRKQQDCQPEKHKQNLKATTRSRLVRACWAISRLQVPPQWMSMNNSWALPMMWNRSSTNHLTSSTVNIDRRSTSNIAGSIVAHKLLQKVIRSKKSKKAILEPMLQRKHVSWSTECRDLASLHEISALESGTKKIRSPVSNLMQLRVIKAIKMTRKTISSNLLTFGASQ